MGGDGKSHVTTPPVKNMRPQVGQLINNKYRLTRMLGDGGMGSVFEAQHEVLGKSVALKFLHPELARRQGLVQRFLQEARVSATIDSKHVVKVSDVEQTPTGLPFMVMEFLKGKSLQALYEDNYQAGKRLAFEDALKYALQMLDGLEAAHDEGVVHRDLKPDNVMIVHGKRNEPIVKLLDFGIAKLKINGELYKGLTRPGVIMGTPEYMAPEQVFSADAVDGRADIFSCGVMFFEMLAGRRPVGGDEAHQIAAAYLSGNVAKLVDLAPHVPSGLAAVVHKAMSPDPKDRYANVTELRDAMEPFTRDLASFTTPPPNATPAASRSDAPPVVAAASPAAALVAETGGSVAAKSPDGWAVDDGSSSLKTNGIDPAATDKMSHPYVGEDVVAISAKLKAATGGKLSKDSTVDGQPFFPGSTAAYQAPISSHPPANGVSGAATVQANGALVGAVRPGGTDIGGAALMPSTANYDTGPAKQASYPAPPTPAAYAPPRRRKKSSMGVGSILLIGSLVAGAVVAGVYAFEHTGKSTPKETAKTFALPSKSIAEPVTESSVVATSPPPQVTYTPPTIATTPATTPPKPTATVPGPRPTATTTTTTTQRPPILPSAIPGLPSSWPKFEFPLPGMGGQQQQPQPTPKDPEPTKPGRPKLEPIPHGAIDPILRPAPITQPRPQVERPQHAQLKLPKIIRTTKTTEKVSDEGAKTNPALKSSRRTTASTKVRAPRR